VRQVSAQALVSAIGKTLLEVAKESPEIVEGIGRAIESIFRGDKEGAAAEAEKAANLAASIATFDTVAKFARERALAREQD